MTRLAEHTLCLKVNQASQIRHSKGILTAPPPLASLESPMIIFKFGWIQRTNTQHRDTVVVQSCLGGGRFGFWLALRPGKISPL